MAESSMLLRLRPSPPPPRLSSLRSISTSSNPNFALKSPVCPRLRPLLLASRAAGRRLACARSEAREAEAADEVGVAVGTPSLVARVGMARVGLGDQAFFLLAFVAVTTSVAFASLVVAAIPTLVATKRAAISLAKLADTAREELPSTMAAIRLSGMEISDLTLELSDLSQEIAEGVNKSAKAVQAAEAGIRQMGALVRQQTKSLIEERANLPDVPIKPAVAGAARRTSHAVGQATKSLMNLLSRGELKGGKEQLSDRVES